MLEYQLRVHMEDFLSMAKVLRPGGQIKLIRKDDRVSFQIAPEDRNDGVEEPYVLKTVEPTGFPGQPDMEDVFPYTRFFGGFGDDVNRYRTLAIKFSGGGMSAMSVDYGLKDRMYDMTRCIMDEDLLVFRVSEEPLDELASPYMVCLDDHDLDGSLTFNARELPYFTDDGHTLRSAEGVPITAVLEQAIELGILSEEGVVLTVTPDKEGWMVKYVEETQMNPLERHFTKAIDVYNEIEENASNAWLAGWLTGGF